MQMSGISGLVFKTKIDNLQLSAVLDKGFISDFDSATTMHFHSYYELLICLEGEILLETENGEKIKIKENSLCVLPPRFYHTTISSPPPAKKLGLRFNYTKDVDFSASKSTYNLCNNLLCGYKKAVVLDNITKLCDIIKLTRKELLSNGLGKEEYASALLTQFFIEFFRALGIESRIDKKESTINTFENEQDFRRLKIDEFFADHYSEQITESELAKQMSMSSRQLNRILNNIYGVGFKKLLMDIRLERSARLLLESDLSVENIAYSVGYTSLSGFYTAFRNKFGLSTKQYRQVFGKQ